MALTHARLPATGRRVAAHTADSVNAAIRRRTAESVHRHARDPMALDRRLEELEREWDIERALEANASTLALAGLGLAAAVDRRFMALPMAVAAFLLQHAVQGWCPPVPVLRRLGFRTQTEIDEERMALKALRGDFDGLPDAAGARRADAVLEAVRR
ncbi:hypothetical protein [Azospirillum sp. A39]|uniref:hypothetical protein n=1 Tax=Azospirillum sp. A39 TaxID=3462279 RepID=UPI004045F0CA